MNKLTSPTKQSKNGNLSITEDNSDVGESLLELPNDSLDQSDSPRQRRESLRRPKQYSPDQRQQSFILEELDTTKQIVPNRSRKRTRKRPVTPITIETRADSSTSRRYRLLLTPTRNKATRRYSPRNDLITLAELLDETSRKKRRVEQTNDNADDGGNDEEEENGGTTTDESEGATSDITPQAGTEDSHSDDSVNEDILDQGSLISSDLDHPETKNESSDEENPSDRKSITTSRLSLAASIADTSNIAIPEAIIRGQGDFSEESEEGQESDINPGMDDILSDIDNDDEPVEPGEVKLDDKERLSFIPIDMIQRMAKARSARGKSKRNDQTKSLSMGKLNIKRLCKFLLPTKERKKVSSAKVIEELDKISQEFFKQETEDLAVYAQYDKRKRITVDDVKLLMHRSKVPPELDLFDFRGGLNSLDNEILRLGSAVYDKEDFNVLEGLLYAKRINELKRRRRKEARINDPDEYGDNDNLPEEVTLDELDKVGTEIPIEFDEPGLQDEVPEIPMEIDDDE